MWNRLCSCDWQQNQKSSFSKPGRPEGKEQSSIHNLPQAGSAVWSHHDKVLNAGQGMTLRILLTLCQWIDHARSGDVSYCPGVLATAPKQFCIKGGQSKLPMLYHPSSTSRSLNIPRSSSFLLPRGDKARVAYLIAAILRPLGMSLEAGKVTALWSKRQKFFLLSIFLDSYHIIWVYCNC